MKHQKRKSIVLFVFLAGLFLLGYFVITQTEQILTETFENKVVMLSDNSAYKIVHGKLDISILQKSFQLQNVLIVPDSLANERNMAQPHIAITSVVANDFELLPLLFNAHLSIEQIDIKDKELIDIIR